MGENQKKILQMVAEGKISVDEATRLLSLVTEGTDTARASDSPGKPKSAPKYLYVKVDPKESGRSKSWDGEGRKPAERVNVRIPVALVRAGMKLTALMPPQVADEINKAIKDKGMGFDIRNLKDEYIEQLIGALQETDIEVDSEDAFVKVYAQ
jgi:hypothetical protein